MRSRPVPGWVLFFLCSSSSSSPPAPPPLHTLHRLLPWCLYRGREGEEIEEEEEPPTPRPTHPPNPPPAHPPTHPPTLTTTGRFTEQTTPFLAVSLSWVTMPRKPAWGDGWVGG